jgi:hypothetical protein
LHPSIAFAILVDVNDQKAGSHARDDHDELTRRDPTSATATDLPTLAFDAATYAKALPDIPWQDKAGVVHKMSEWYELTAVRTITER